MMTKDELKAAADREFAERQIKYPPIDVSKCRRVKEVTRRVYLFDGTPQNIEDLLTAVKARTHDAVSKVHAEFRILNEEEAAIFLTFEVPETDADVVARVEAERAAAKTAQATENAEYETFLRLKAKYESGLATKPKKNEESTTLCWHCFMAYQMVDHVCPYCGATNANFDLERAEAEVESRVSIRRA